MNDSTRSENDHNGRDRAGRRAGLIGRVFRLSYERIGLRHPRAHLLIALLLGLVAGAVGPVTLTLYFEMSSGEFLRILLAAESMIWIPEVAIAAAITSRASAR